MEFLGNKMVMINGEMVMGSEYKIELEQEDRDKILMTATREQLQDLLDTQLRMDNFEGAALIRDLIKIRFGS